jgi:hypothetical protein
MTVISGRDTWSESEYHEVGNDLFLGIRTGSSGPVVLTLVQAPPDGLAFLALWSVGPVPGGQGFVIKATYANRRPTAIDVCWMQDVPDPNHVTREKVVIDTP